MDICYSQTRLLCEFRSGTHGLKKELGKHRVIKLREIRLLNCTNCESVVHVLMEYSVIEPHFQFGGWSSTRCKYLH